MAEVCAVDGCERTDRVAKGYCGMHYARIRRNGDIEPRYSHRGPRPAIRGERNAQWLGDAAGYGAAHDRMRVRRGKASEHKCEHCRAPAVQWAYDHNDPEERFDPRGLPYSLDPGYYIALCLSCHKKLDVQYTRPKTHCPQGHPYSGANLYLDPKGRRKCRTCHRERDQRLRDQTATGTNAKPRWTDAEMAIALDPSLTRLEAALAVGRSYSAVGCLRARYGRMRERVS